MINSKATKLEETTVTLQSKNPRNPITKKVMPALQNKGKETHLALLKTIDREIRKRTNTPKPKVFKSF